MLRMINSNIIYVQYNNPAISQTRRTVCSPCSWNLLSVPIKAGLGDFHTQGTGADLGKNTSVSWQGGVSEEIGERSFFGFDRDWLENTWSGQGMRTIEIKIPAEYIRQDSGNEKEVYIEGNIKPIGSVWIPVPGGVVRHDQIIQTPEINSDPVFRRLFSGKTRFSLRNGQSVSGHAEETCTKSKQCFPAEQQKRTAAFDQKLFHTGPFLFFSPSLAFLII